MTGNKIDMSSPCSTFISTQYNLLSTGRKPTNSIFFIALLYGFGAILEANGVFDIGLFAKKLMYSGRRVCCFAPIKITKK